MENVTVQLQCLVTSRFLMRYTQGGPIKTVHFKKCITPACDDRGRQSVHQYVRLFIRSTADILNNTRVKYSLHNFTETILHQNAH